MTQLTLNHIYKKYDNAEDFSVTDFNLKINDKEFIVFVGPSGCGKSTTLRMIAGLEDITDGDLMIGDKIVNNAPPKDRDIAMVFQNYALYPHMSVYDNMAFSLKLRKYEKDEIKRRVENTAEILGLSDYLQRKPAALSGGQKQRVALGRAIVRDAQVFLMDEPLSNLDAKLRVSMRAEIARLHQSLGTTTIYVTHDQTEAMTMADRIVIMKDGLIQQVGTPQEVYDTPVNVFVAGFIGSPAMNFFEVTLKNGFISDGHGLSLKVPDGGNRALVRKGYEGKTITFGIRPEDIHSEQIALDSSDGAVVNAEVMVSELLGAETLLYTKVGDTEFVSRVDARDFHKPGAQVALAFNLGKAHFFDKETQEVIMLND
ncbi:ABC transporter ATP-binding protein [Enterococcus xiangfangensis]|uniref:Sn-glycerol-3-phosphate ABC transporter ATP-binding protein UgpC n=1 Tax=Enterococcus xiangfangensis TaxID=1296537 RepID=A0ABU3F9H2_9ENTE|nr:sn-glycerol-3-phosphate ABC transporter ATP-binding protein UgpC [Enterococcus xiangfangensis]MBM7711163.1 multiple sugar transport system ATP-binding protein [Enterococcus xiangfangensis]MDT2759130.1 sn-glycerol-3-phosphate ABC transporter ATP-binding protein UgpC [Enterococcus xiangfangensis]